jgi:hypothetical protein
MLSNHYVFWQVEGTADEAYEILTDQATGDFVGRGVWSFNKDCDAN